MELKKKVYKTELAKWQSRAAYSLLKYSPYFWGKHFGPHLVVLSGYFWFSVQGWFLVMF